jgi:hypothetical protein
MPPIPSKLSSLLESLTVQFPVLLGRNLVGAYLYGSVTHNGFNPKRSDVDCLVVTHRDLSDAQFRRLGAWLEQNEKSNPWTLRLQMSFLLKDHVLTMNSKACHYQFGVLERGSSDGNPIIWLDYQRTGRILFGSPPETFLPAITPKIFSAALDRELAYVKEEISEKPSSEWRDVRMYRAYAVLTICRILYSTEKRSTTSKADAAKWVIKKWPRRWTKIINRALAFNEIGRESDIPLKEIEEFISFTATQLRSSRFVQS